jgi:hypothetical protein
MWPYARLSNQKRTVNINDPTTTQLNLPSAKAASLFRNHGAMPLGGDSNK